MKRLLFLGLMIAISLVGCASGQTKGMVSHKSLPIIDNNGADPWVYRKDDTYYYTKTTGNNVTLWKSNHLSTMASGQEKIVWEMPNQFESAWAPELHYFDGQWVIYVAVNKPTQTHRMYALTNKEKDPFKGEWQLSAVQGMDDKFAIDGTVLQLDSGNYFIWSGWEGYENIAQNLYIAKMESPTQISGQKMLISKPELEWEKRQTPLVNEGPQIIISGDTVNLVYSASGSWDDDYCLGLLTMSTKDNPLERQNWTKKAQPILAKNDKIFGPGHGSFTKDDKGQDWLVYHAARWSHSGWTRSVRFQKLILKDNQLQEMSLAASDKMIDLPAGDTERLTFLAKDGKYSDSLTIDEDPTYSVNQVLTGFADRKEELTFQFNLKKPGQYHLAFYIKTLDNWDPENVLEARIGANGKSYQASVEPSDYYQPTYVTLDLKKGQNEVSLNFPTGGDRLSLLVQHSSLSTTDKKTILTYFETVEILEANLNQAYDAFEQATLTQNDQLRQLTTKIDAIYEKHGVTKETLVAYYSTMSITAD